VIGQSRERRVGRKAMHFALSLAMDEVSLPGGVNGDGKGTLHYKYYITGTSEVLSPPMTWQARHPVWPPGRYSHEF